MTVVNPGFLDRGFICIKVWGFALQNVSKFYFIKYNFHRIFKIEGGLSEPLEPPLNPPLYVCGVYKLFTVGIKETLILNMQCISMIVSEKMITLLIGVIK